MMKNEYTAHRSMVLAVREAVALYLINQDREEDILKISKCFSTVDNYQGNRLPISLIINEVDYICSVLNDNYLGLNLHSLIDIKSLPFYRAINDCIKPFAIVNDELPFLLISRLVFRFFFLLTESVGLEIIPKKNALRLDIIPRDINLMNKHQIDGIMMILHRVLKDFCPGTLKSVHIAQRNSTYELKEYTNFFAVAAKISDTTSLTYNLRCKDNYRDAAKRLMKCEIEIGRKFFISPLMNMLQEDFAEISYKHRCEMVIDIIIGIDTPTRNNVAEAMNISTSTLQRRLSEENVTFKEILESKRKQLAKMYLAQDTITITDTAYLVGYKSHSQFFTAFKTWFGTTPKEYRYAITAQTAIA